MNFAKVSGVPRSSMQTALDLCCRYIIPCSVLDMCQMNLRSEQFITYMQMLILTGELSRTRNFSYVTTIEPIMTDDVIRTRIKPVYLSERRTAKMNKKDMFDLYNHYHIAHLRSFLLTL
jgi:hypothetical protein